MEYAFTKSVDWCQAYLSLASSFAETSFQSFAQLNDLIVPRSDCDNNEIKSSGCFLKYFSKASSRRGVCSTKKQLVAACESALLSSSRLGTGSCTILADNPDCSRSSNVLLAAEIVLNTPRIFGHISCSADTYHGH